VGGSFLRGAPQRAVFTRACGLFIVVIPTLLHEVVNAEYSRFRNDISMTEYQWLQTQPYDVQREEGLKILRNLHILK
jgi:hypothetical protein